MKATTISLAIAAVIAMNTDTNAFAQKILPPPLPPEPPVVRVLNLRADEKPVAVEKAETVVEEDAFFKRVKATFTFTNPNARVMAGEFEFPIPEGAFVCGYALEVNGEMVPGVVCEKEKARVAFENEVRKGVDPGLVEQVKGNVWKTRIFPLNPNTPRRAEVEYVEPKPTDNAPNIVAERDGDDVFVATVGKAETKSVRDTIAAFDKGAILWDASMSAKAKSAAWRAKLEALPEKGEWKLVVFRNVAEAPAEFSDRAALLAAIDALDYDGGTDIAAAIESCASSLGSASLLFSDEIDTLGLVNPKYEDIKGLVIASRPDAPARAVDVRKLNPATVEIRKDVHTHNPGEEKQPTSAAPVEGKLLATVWAARRMQDLASQADARKDEFLALGRKYGVVGPGLSLIVLETLDQWLEHKIEPPASLSFHDEWVKRRAAEDDPI
ncbi:MAG: hypothetical protein J5807_02580, partial [Kiritimatiellae bacterium]|nr:hypothetical protein [Kiritimatiellia bacterium]